MSRPHTMAAPTNSAVTPQDSRFELPALDFKFSSLTEGTDIPPPVSEEDEDETGAAPPPQSPTKDKTMIINANGITAAASPESHVSQLTTSAQSSDGVAHIMDEMGSSPTASTRPGSIRRLFSRNLLNSAYCNGDDAASDAGTEGPGSGRTNSSFAQVSSAVVKKRPKRGSGWFARLRNGGMERRPAAGFDKRASVMVLLSQKQQQSPGPGNDGIAPVIMASVTTTTIMDEKPMAEGPPPPMIPELSELQSKINVDDGGSLGGDLFKNIY